MTLPFPVKPTSPFVQWLNDTNNRNIAGARIHSARAWVDTVDPIWSSLSDVSHFR
jgi:hypothetical protein